MLRIEAELLIPGRGDPFRDPGQLRSGYDADLITVDADPWPTWPCWPTPTASRASGWAAAV